MAGLAAQFCQMESVLSVWLQMQFHVIYIKILKLLLSNFFCPQNTFSAYLLRVNKVIKKGGHRARFFATRRQMEGKGAISASNDHFPRKDWGEFQDGFECYARKEMRGAKQGNHLKGLIITLPRCQELQLLACLSLK